MMRESRQSGSRDPSHTAKLAPASAPGHFLEVIDTPAQPTARSHWANIPADAAIFAAATLGTYAAQLFERPITAVLVYLIGIILVGAHSGLKHGLLAALTAAAIYNFVLSDPVLRFGVSTLDELVPLIAFTVAALVTGILAGKLTDRAHAAQVAQVENARLLEQLYEARTRQKTEELKDAIFSSVSHDLRTPITAIEAAADSLSTSGLDLPSEHRQALLRTISEQCRRLNRYTSDLLDVGRIQSGISPDAFTEIDVIEMLGVALARLRAQYPHARIEKDIDSFQAPVRANGAMLEQAIYNVLDNAVVHGGTDARMTIRVASDHRQCRLEVMDEGPGIPSAEHGRVFERFARGSASLGTSGSGLGLFIARGFVEAFAGHIEVTSPLEAGQGTRIAVILPLAVGTGEAS